MNRIDKSIFSWKPVPNFPGYFAIKTGKIISTKRSKPRILSPIKSKSGHLYVFLYYKKIMYKKWVHQLVLLSHNIFPSFNQECRHLNGNPEDNRLENLQWGTRQENANDRKRHGKVPYGEKAGSHKLNENQVLEIRREIGKQTLRKLAKKYGVSHTCIRRAAIGMTWRYL